MLRAAPRGLLGSPRDVARAVHDKHGLDGHGLEPGPAPGLGDGPSLATRRRGAHSRQLRNHCRSSRQRLVIRLLFFFFQGSLPVQVLSRGARSPTLVRTLSVSEGARSSTRVRTLVSLRGPVIDLCQDPLVVHELLGAVVSDPSVELRLWGDHRSCHHAECLSRRAQPPQPRWLGIRLKARLTGPRTLSDKGPWRLSVPG